MPDTIPILLDTDIGSDIDDAVALEYLLRQPRCDLLGITTVTGDVAKRAALAQVLCNAAGRPNVPIHAGASPVLLRGPGQPGVPQYETVKHLPHSLDWPPNTAVEFMRRTIRERPNEVTLVSIGPLTNVALLFATDPEVAPRLKSWVSMAGNFTDASDTKLEWNSRCDPLATAIAFQAEVPEHIHVGLNVTLQCRRSADEVRALFTGPVQEVVLRIAESWFEDRQEIVFHDPLAVALPFQPLVCDVQKGTVRVDSSTGATLFARDDSGRDRVAVQVDSDRFFAEYDRPALLSQE